MTGAHLEVQRTVAMLCGWVGLSSKVGWGKKDIG